MFNFKFCESLFDQYRYLTKSQNKMDQILLWLVLTTGSLLVGMFKKSASKGLSGCLENTGWGSPSAAFFVFIWRSRKKRLVLT
jgi:hypothetical protein